MTKLAAPTSTSNQENVKILFNNEPANKATTHGGGKSAQKSTPGSTTNFSSSNTGDLDALASAALQASTGMHINYIKYFYNTNYD